MKRVKGTWGMLCLVVLFVSSAAGVASMPASPFGATELWQPGLEPGAIGRITLSPSDGQSPSGADLSSSLVAGADYLKTMQADVTEDNAGNGTDGVDESPDDPDDGGWDWRVTSPPDPFFHTTASSPKNLYGATALGLYYAYLETSDATYLTALTDAADIMVADAEIWSAADIVFLVLYNSLPEVTGTTYSDAAKTKFDARIASQGSATGLAEDVRDVRAAQGHTNGIIAWDVGMFIRGASLLAAEYPSDPYDYAQAAVDMAEVLWQDSYNDSPGHFDIVDDAGWDPSYADMNFYFYTLGITGLIDAFSLSGVHTDEIPDLVDRILASQYPWGALSYCYGANAGDEDWQSTGFGAMTLGRLDKAAYQNEINHLAYWLAQTQDASGGWRYAGSTDNHYPEVAAECLRGMYYATPGPVEVVVDDDFAGQTEVDAYNTIHGTGYIWEYDAFSTIQEGVDAVSGSTIHVEPGTYREQIYVDKSLDLVGSGLGVSIVEALDPEDRTSYGITQWSGTARSIDACIGVVGAETVNISGLTIDGRNQGRANFYGIHFFDAGGSVVDCQIEDITFPGSPGTQSVLSLVATHSLGEAFHLEVRGCSFYTFQKGGMAIMGPGATCLVEDNDVNGAYNPNIASNGIQISYGCMGVLSNNSISGVEYPGLQWASTGILLLETADITVTGGEVVGCESGITHAEWNWVHTVPGTSNIVIDDVTFASNRWSITEHLADDATTVNLEVMNCYVSGTENAGIELWGSVASSLHEDWTNGTMTVNIHDNRIVDGNVGVEERIESADGCTVDVRINGNSFDGNYSLGVYNNFSNMIDAIGNWWGDAGAAASSAAAADMPSGVTRRLAIPYGGEEMESTIERTVFRPTYAAPGVGVSPNVDYSPWWGEEYVEDSHSSPWVWYMDNSNGSTIQEAIDEVAVGDEINVLAGEYHNDPVYVNKAVTVRGAQADVDPAGATSRGSETVITRDDGAAGILVTASGATVNGFKVGNEDAASSGGIAVFAGATDVTVSHNIVMNTTEDYGEGVYVGLGADGANVANNTVVNSHLQGIANVGGSGAVIAGNWISDVDNEAIAAEVACEISGNTVEQCLKGILSRHAGTGPSDRVEITGNTVSFISQPGIFIGEDTTGAGKYTLVSGNVIHDCNVDDPDPWAFASVHVERGASHTIIDGNEIYDGINGVQTWADNVSITNNEIYEMGLSYNTNLKNMAILVGTKFDYPVNYDPIGNVIHHNRIHDNHWGLHYGTHLIKGVNAEYNYWGDTTGPGHMGLNPEGLGDPVSDNVDFDPWCNWDFTVCTYTADCCGKYTGGYTGNANCSIDGAITLSDISRIVDRVFISKQNLCCEANGNTNGDLEGRITLSDVTRVIDKVYISKLPCATCW